MTATLPECVDAVDPLRSTSRLLAGSPFLARGASVVAARDPLGLGTPATAEAVGEMRDAARADHAPPQRQAFRLPVCECAAAARESADE
ncbi:hypothetical protein GWC77_00660 [Paraburkholderia sp. NMBU_R16]|uniref:hypothetical protein n=1 Tax=Paraburkholderia sp. NMBU_R16 TaxID=2698676 RepID=UPI001566C2E9|nr:hypothetical protein [Paraburkholderia sp. NMBU_R16]NRO94453.1 hypothetical protein [Paraburkholderia sp. NMBU_R16]